jgi:hypothetical protein
MSEFPADAGHRDYRDLAQQFLFVTGGPKNEWTSADVGRVAVQLQALAEGGALAFQKLMDSGWFIGQKMTENKLDAIPKMEEVCVSVSTGSLYQLLTERRLLEARVQELLERNTELLLENQSLKATAP